MCAVSKIKLTFIFLDRFLLRVLIFCCFFFYFCCCYFVSFNFDRLKNVWNSGFQKLKTYKRTKSKLEQPFAILRLDINDSKETKIVIGKKNSWHETSTRKYLQIHQNLWALPWNIWAITQNIWAIDLVTTADKYFIISTLFFYLYNNYQYLYKMRLLYAHAHNSQLQQNISW